MNNCAICSEELSSVHDVVTLGEKGVRGVNAASVLRQSNITVHENQVVHVKCRKAFCNTNLISKSNKANITNKNDLSRASTSSSPTLRSIERKFDFKTHCLFCCQVVDIAIQSFGRESKKYPVRTKVFDKSILNVCKERNDAWANDVKKRLHQAIDLHAADTIYHQVCSVNFRTGKKIPLQFSPAQCKSKNDSNRSGRPKDKTKEEAFLKTMVYIEENEDELFTVGDLVKCMEKYLENTGFEAYTNRYMKEKIEKHYGDNVIISEICGQSDVVTLRFTVSVILNNYHKSQSKDMAEEKTKIIKTAAKLIKNDIKSLPRQSDMYPSCAEMAVVEECLAFIPESLRIFLSDIFAVRNESNNVKIASIGQAIVQAAGTRGILAPLQLGLAVQMHHHFASRFLIDSLSSHGFCCSYDETRKFERCAAISTGTSIPGFIPGRFVQYIADNADHNVRSLDGRGTFHGMAIIATITPKVSSENRISRKTVTNEDIANVGRIRIDFYKSQQDMVLCYNKLSNIHSEDRTANIDYLWKVSWLLKPHRPNWSGTMQAIHHGDFPGQSSLVFLPMIDMNPGDMSCIYSTLLFISDHAKKYNVTPIVTFDQPLWWKALNIILSALETSVLKSIVLRLGGFHTEMSFLGCIGHLMAGSGIEELLETTFATNTIEYLLSGKAIARAVRGHLLIDAALNTILAKQVFNTECNATANDDTMEVEDNDIKEAKILYEHLMTGVETAENVNNSEVLIRIKDKINTYKETLITFRTAKLWLQYMKMVDILKSFLKAERTGNWKLHLQAVRDMLPFFAAAGHNMYAKSARIYLQMMIELEVTHPDIYESFNHGLHVVRRSDRFWAGLSTDLIIEQCFMKNMKSTGGLTRGRGITETQRHIFVMGMPVFAELNAALTEVTGVDCATSEQHVDTSKSRSIRDTKDTSSMITFLESMNPFDTDGSSDLHSISSGMTAGKFVNADTAEIIGNQILEEMTDSDVLLYTFRKKNQVTTLSSKTLKIEKQNVQIDPYLAFQRLVTTAKTKEKEMGHFFMYELTIYPPALFETCGLPRQANKPVLAESIWTATKSNTHQITMPTTTKFVIDGGYLLHRIPWPRQSTYENILTSYASYVNKHYGRAIVVFDGYKETLSTKDVAHLRRVEGSIGATVDFEVNMIVPLKKVQFLSNTSNKQRFIDFLTERLIISGCTVHNAKSDADLMIVEKTVQCSNTQSTVLIGEDTDLLVLLLYYSPPEADIYFKSEPKVNQRVPKVWSISYTKMMLGFETCYHILFAHAFLGCDTTSRIFGLGKGAAIKHLQSEETFFKDQASVFSLPQNEVTQDKIADAGERALVFIYSGKKDLGINDLRYQMFCDKVRSSHSHVKPENLPPTKAATRQHCMRVYHQVQQWKGVDLNPELWGWKKKDNKLYPVDTDLPPAPSELLHAIVCSCKTDCETLRCSCRKHGMNCTTACKECRGICCTNSPQPDLTDDEDDEDDDPDEF